MASMIAITASLLALTPPTDNFASHELAEAIHPADSAIERWRPLIKLASRRFDIPEDWIIAVMRAESGGRTHLNGRSITSHAGAMGLMQLMPDTWDELRRQHSLGNDPHYPADNILAGAAYLRAMYDRFGYPGLFGAYNAGPARYARHLMTGRRLPSETRAYLAAVINETKDAVPRHDVVRRDILFVMRSTTASVDPNPASRPNSLFFALNAAGRPPKIPSP